MGNATKSAESAPEISHEEALAMTENLAENLTNESGEGEGDSRSEELTMLANNPFFRCLGYHEGDLVFTNKRTAHIQYVKVDKLSNKVFLSLAPFEFWQGFCPKVDDKGKVVGVLWERVTDHVFRATEDAGIWNDRKKHAQGARFDHGRVAYHTGEKVWIEGVGLINPGEVQGENCYTSRIGARLPDFNEPFGAESDEIRQLQTIIRSLAWRQDSRGLSEMTLFGYLMIAPICGLLSWRPHVWLDGARGDGKTWVVQNIINRVLGPHCEMVKSNSTESGLRNLLDARSIPTIFDEAEGSSMRDKARMEETIALARHTSSETDAVVAQGVSGGGASRRYAVSSMFFFASIATRIDKPSDHTRFARISLGPGLRGREFIENVEVPALRLLTEKFTDKFVGRAVTRAHHLPHIIRVMTAALMLSGMERRVADVYAVFASGAWLALRDDLPENEQQCFDFIRREFGALEQIQSVNTNLSQDRDHDRVLRHILSSNRRIETGNGPVISEKTAVLMRIVCGKRDFDDDAIVTVPDALKELNNMGIRPAKDGVACDAGDEVTHFLFHRKSETIREILSKTPYETGFGDILLQAPGVKVGVKSTRFRGASPERGLLIPLEILFGTDPEGDEEGDSAADQEVARRADPFGEADVFEEFRPEFSSAKAQPNPADIDISDWTRTNDVPWPEDDDNQVVSKENKSPP